MALRVRGRSGVNISRVVSKVVATVLALYVGGTIMTEVGNAMLNESSPFFTGLTLIGWQVEGTKIVGTDGSGILSVIGIIGIASIVMEFVQITF